MINLPNLISELTENGKEVRVRDIAYAILRRHIDDPLLPYKVVFDANATEADMKKYETDKIKDIIKYVSASVDNDIEISDDSISFTENRAALVRMLSVLPEKLEAKEISYKDAAKLEADIRVKLNSQFQVQDEDRGTIVVVPAKFNHICSRFSCECYIYDKEFAKKEFHLIDDPKYKGKDNAK